MSRFLEYLNHQQRHALPRTGTQLEDLGKQAAARWASGSGCVTLHDAVVGVVKDASLAPEQVRRVAEFANINAYLTLHRKEGGVNKYIDFGEGGPANAVDILRDLNSTGGGMKMSSTQLDPVTPAGESPGTITEEQFQAFFFPKAAQAGEEKTASEQDFERSGRELLDLEAQIVRELDDQRGKLAYLVNREELGASNLLEHIKEACRAGHSLGEVVDVLSHFAEESEVKSAMIRLMPRLCSEVFYSGEEAAESLKTASRNVGRPDPDHPIIHAFQSYKVGSAYLEEKDAECKSLSNALEKVKAARSKTASGGGVVGKGMNHLHALADAAGGLGTSAGKYLFGGSGRAVGTAAKAMTYAAPVVVAHEVYRRNLKNSPVVGAAKSLIPGTPEYYAAEMDQNPYGMMGGY